MKQFTPSTRLYSIRHCKQFAPFKKYMIAPRKFAALMQVYSIKNLAWFYPVNAQDTAEALNKMRVRAQDGSFFTNRSKGKVRPPKAGSQGR